MHDLVHLEIVNHCIYFHHVVIRVAIICIMYSAHNQGASRQESEKLIKKFEDYMEESYSTYLSLVVNIFILDGRIALSSYPQLTDRKQTHHAAL